MVTLIFLNWWIWYIFNEEDIDDTQQLNTQSQYDKSNEDDKEAFNSLSLQDVFETGKKKLIEVDISKIRETRNKRLSREDFSRTWFYRYLKEMNLK